MNWCWLIGHHFKLTQIGNNCYKSCRCMKSYVLVEKVDRASGTVRDTYWKPLDDLRRGKK